MPVVAGTGYNAVMGAEIARKAEKAGADCILALPPYYINAPENGLFAYYEAIGKANRAASIPVQPRLGRLLATTRWRGWRSACRPWPAGRTEQGVARKYHRMHYESGRRPPCLVRRAR